MAYEVTWTETTPLNTDEVLEGALRIRETKQGVRERVNRDHFFGGATGAAMAAESGLTEGNDSGYHRRVTLQERSSYESASRSRINTVNSGATTKFGEIFLSEVGSSAELKFTSSAQNTRTLVSTDQSQTLTNKTLTSPTINSATIDMNSGTIDNAVIGGATPQTAMFTKVGINTSLPSSDGDLTVGNILTVNGASTFTGTATLNGSITLAGTTTLTGDLAGAKFRTEDDFGSASATSVASSLSIKNFVQSGNYTFTNKTYSNPTISGTISPSGALTWNNTDLVNNLNANFLQGSDKAYFRNANHMNAGTLSFDRLPSQSAFQDTRHLIGTSSSGAVANDSGWQTTGLEQIYIESNASDARYFILNPKGSQTAALWYQKYDGDIVDVSDGRLKTNVQPTKLGGLNVINKLKFVEFDWTKDSIHTGSKKIGIIAQDLESVYPDAVKSTIMAKPGFNEMNVPLAEMPEYKHYDNKDLILIAMKAIQELSAEVKTLKA